MTKKEQLQKDLELQAETIGYLRERIAELEEKLERKECGNKLLADKLEDVTKVKIGLEQKLEQIKDEKFEKALSQIKHDREVVIEYNEKLQKENTELKEKLKPENCIEYLAKGGYVKFLCENGKEHDQLAEAKKIILMLYNAGRDVLMCRNEEKAYDNLSKAVNDKSIEQFISEVEK